MIKKLYFVSAHLNYGFRFISTHGGIMFRRLLPFIMPFWRTDCFKRNLIKNSGILRIGQK